MEWATAKRINGQWVVLLPLGDKVRCRSELEARGIALGFNSVHGERKVEDLQHANRLLRQAGCHPVNCRMHMRVQMHLWDRGVRDELDILGAW